MKLNPPIATHISNTHGITMYWKKVPTTWNSEKQCMNLCWAYWTGSQWLKDPTASSRHFQVLPTLPATDKIRGLEACYIVIDELQVT